MEKREVGVVDVERSVRGRGRGLGTLFPATNEVSNGVFTRERNKKWIWAKNNTLHTKLKLEYDAVT